jgi:hypothetical protein
MNRNLLAAAGLLAMTVALPHPAQAAKASKKPQHKVVKAHAVKQKPITVIPTTFHGWKNAYRVSNGVVDLVIVPAIGRVMAYHLTGDPTSSPLWVNPATEGKLSPPDAWTFYNFGGSELWPAPQDDWPSHQGGGWPPEVAVDRGPYVLSRIFNGVRLTGPASKNYAIRATRDITLTPGGTRVTLKASFKKAADAAGDKDAFPIGIWADLQVRGDATVYFPLSSHSRFGEMGYTVLRDQAPPSPYWSTVDGVLVLKRYPTGSSKLGLDDFDGWMAAKFGNNMLFSEQFHYIADATYPDKGTNAQFYTNADPDAFMEMEAQSPLRKLAAGQQMSETITWNLQRLPRTPADTSDEVVLVKKLAR